MQSIQTGHIPGLGSKRIDYVYDLVSGNVNLNYVFYQLDSTDQFLQKYTYDADNRLTEVKSSSDGFIWNTEARYFYYPHSPLARVELGERSVQGLIIYKFCLEVALHLFMDIFSHFKSFGFS